MKFFLTSVLCLLTSWALRAQAPRPPTTYLSGLLDVNIVSPTDDQPLVYDLATLKWTNTNTLDNIILQSTTITPSPGTVANFGAAKLQHPSAGDVIDWSTGNLKILQPIQDSTAKTAISIENRQLFGTDGTTVKVQWDGTGVILPTLAQATTGVQFVTTDTTGKLLLGNLAGAGTIPATNQLLMGDGFGNAMDASIVAGLSVTAPTLTYGSTGNYQSSINVTNQGGPIYPAQTAAFIATAGNSVKLESLSPSFTPTGIYSAGDARLVLSAGNLDIVTNATAIKYSFDNGATSPIQMGAGLGVGVATPPGSGNLDVSSAYRINGTALAQVYMNGSAAGVSGGFATNTAIPGSVITVPAGAWKVGGSYHSVFDMSKTAAGTAAIVINVHMGTLGTVSDTIVGSVTFAAGTAVADDGIFDVYVTFKSVGSGTSAVIQIYAKLNKLGTTTGLVNSAAVFTRAGGASAGFNSTTQTKISLGFNGGASYVGSNGSCQTEYKQ